MLTNAQERTETLYTLQMGEIVKFHNAGNWEVMRVPGGWIFSFSDPNYSGAMLLTSTFVPYNFDDAPEWIKAASEAGFFDPSVTVSSEGLNQDKADDKVEN